MLERILAGVEFQVSVSERSSKSWKKCSLRLFPKPPGSQGMNEQPPKTPEKGSMAKSQPMSPFIRFTQLSAATAESFPTDVEIRKLTSCTLSKTNTHGDEQYDNCCISIVLHNAFFKEIFLVAPSEHHTLAFLYDMKVLLACASVYKGASDFKPLLKEPSELAAKRPPSTSEPSFQDFDDDFEEDEQETEFPTPTLLKRLKQTLVAIHYTNPAPKEPLEQIEASADVPNRAHLAQFLSPKSSFAYISRTPKHPGLTPAGSLGSMRSPRRSPRHSQESYEGGKPPPPHPAG
mmetsp:Transcript_4817/g.8311  ORF Transcript_4817/g.8311 Transcript_4817/m.8311 type:complete len:290 (+) Transcript_4817:111-980(+)